MKKIVAFWVVVIALTKILCSKDEILERLHAQPQPASPVTVNWVSPVAGSTISNTVTLTVNAGSTAGRISKIVWFVDDQPFATNFYTPPSPVGFAVVQK